MNGVPMVAGAEPPHALVLDFGCVISKSVFELPREVEAAFGLAPHSYRWRGPLAPETDELWQSWQRGELTEREYWARRAADVARLCGRDVDTRTLMISTYETAGETGLRPQTAAVIAQARAAGLKVGVLTNELELFHGRSFIESLPVLQHMDAIVDATHTRILKPDPRAYTAIAAALGVPPERALFVDDQQRNVDGAHAVGMPAILMRIDDVEGSIAAVRAALGFAAPHAGEPAGSIVEA